MTPDYYSPVRFTGTLHTATIGVSGGLVTDAEGEMRMHPARR